MKEEEKNLEKDVNDFEFKKIQASYTLHTIYEFFRSIIQRIVRKKLKHQKFTSQFFIFLTMDAFFYKPQNSMYTFHPFCSHMNRIYSFWYPSCSSERFKL